MCADRSAEVFSDAAKAETRRWLDRWRVVGPMLEEERWARLRASSDEQLQRESWDLLELWSPDARGDDGGGLIILQRHFTRWSGFPVNGDPASNR